MLLLVERRTIALSGDVESEFFDRVRIITRHDSAALFGEILESLHVADLECVAVIRNEALVLDRHLPESIEKTLLAVDAFDDRWAVAGAGGLGPTGARYCAMYSGAEPFLRMGPAVRPIIDVFPDLYLLNAGFLSELTGEPLSRLDVAFETFAIALGYLKQRVSLYTPTLSAGINGHFRRRDFSKFSTELQNHLGDRLTGNQIDTLTGVIALTDRHNLEETDPVASIYPYSPSRRVNLRKVTNETILAHCDKLKISIVTRTQFQRPHLLRRLLASVTRAKEEFVEIEVVLATDSDDPRRDEELNDLKASFPDLDINLVRNVHKTHSRVGNLLAGLIGASKEYVLFLDDDDYLDVMAFSNIRPALFRGARPIVISDSQVHEEQWIQTGPGRHILAQAKPIRVHGHADWRQTFSGVNMMPICGALYVRDALTARIRNLPLRYDLSEDYAVSLAILTDPKLPELYELPATVAHISVRANENTITLTDRRRWARDIAGFIHDLTETSVASPGMWDVLTRQRRGPENDAKDVIISELHAQISSKTRQITQLRDRLTRLLRQLPKERDHGNREQRTAETTTVTRVRGRKRLREIGGVS